MPELPEVETIKNDLLPQLVGRHFTGVRIEWPGAVRPTPEALSNGIAGQRIEALERRGKYLILRLSGGPSLVIHLRMSGSLLLRASTAAPDLYTRNTFLLDGGLELRFVDRRKLGRIWLVDDAAQVVGDLGPEPLEGDFTPQVLSERLKRRSGPIKAVLLDQSFLAGVGNMYADEALFLARLHPLRAANSLSAEDTEKLYHAIRAVLRTAIKHRGTTFSDYQRPDGEPGTHQFHFHVAHRGGLPCNVCRTLVQRIEVRGRGTYFCPRCQAQ